MDSASAPAVSSGNHGDEDADEVLRARCLAEPDEGTLLRTLLDALQQQQNSVTAPSPSPSDLVEVSASEAPKLSRSPPDALSVVLQELCGVLVDGVDSGSNRHADGGRVSGLGPEHDARTASLYKTLERAQLRVPLRATKKSYPCDSEERADFNHIVSLLMRDARPAHGADESLATLAESSSSLSPLALWLPHLVIPLLQRRRREGRDRLVALQQEAQLGLDAVEGEQQAAKQRERRQDALDDRHMDMVASSLIDAVGQAHLQNTAEQCRQCDADLLQSLSTSAYTSSTCSTSRVNELVAAPPHVAAAVSAKRRHELRTASAVQLMYALGSFATATGSFKALCVAAAVLLQAQAQWVMLEARAVYVHVLRSSFSQKTIAAGLPSAQAALAGEQERLAARVRAAVRSVARTCAMELECQWRVCLSRYGGGAMYDAPDAGSNNNNSSTTSATSHSNVIEGDSFAIDQLHESHWVCLVSLITCARVAAADEAQCSSSASSHSGPTQAFGNEAVTMAVAEAVPMLLKRVSEGLARYASCRVYTVGQDLLHTTEAERGPLWGCHNMLCRRDFFWNCVADQLKLTRYHSTNNGTARDGGNKDESRDKRKEHKDEEKAEESKQALMRSLDAFWGQLLLVYEQLTAAQAPDEEAAVAAALSGADGGGSLVKSSFGVGGSGGSGGTSGSVAGGVGAVNTDEGIVGMLHAMRREYRACALRCLTREQQRLESSCKGLARRLERLEMKVQRQRSRAKRARDSLLQHSDGASVHVSDAEEDKEKEGRGREIAPQNGQPREEEEESEGHSAVRSLRTRLSSRHSSTSAAADRLAQFMDSTFWQLYHPSCFVVLRPERQRVLTRVLAALHKLIIVDAKEVQERLTRKVAPPDPDSAAKVPPTLALQHEEALPWAVIRASEEVWSSEEEENDDESNQRKQQHQQSEGGAAAGQDTSKNPSISANSERGAMMSISTTIGRDPRLVMGLVHTLFTLLERRGKISQDDYDALHTSLLPTLMHLTSAATGQDHTTGTDPGELTTLSLIVSGLLALPWSVEGIYLALQRYHVLGPYAIMNQLQELQADLPSPISLEIGKRQLDTLVEQSCSRLRAWVQNPDRSLDSTLDANAHEETLGMLYSRVEDSHKQHDSFFIALLTGAIAIDDVAVDDNLRRVTPVHLPAASPCALLLVVGAYRTLHRELCRLRAAWEEQRRLAQEDGAQNYMGRTETFCTSQDVTVFRTLLQVVHRTVFGTQWQPQGLLRLWMGYLRHLFTSVVPGAAREDVVELMPRSWQQKQSVTNCLGEVTDRSGWKAVKDAMDRSSQSDLRAELGALLAELVLLPLSESSASTECPAACPATLFASLTQLPSDILSTVTSFPALVAQLRYVEKAQQEQEMSVLQRTFPHAVIETVCMMLCIDTTATVGCSTIGAAEGDVSASVVEAAAEGIESSFLGLVGLLAFCRRLESLIVPGTVQDIHLAQLIRCVWAVADAAVLRH